ncbi:T9SS type A sorting domain-containing protein, partial [Bacteroidales bacterium AH-315-N07]|nr:T9SS type A sorting domain-containing protein [Bacteroidales bacterium AH-315-N07]
SFTVRLAVEVGETGNHQLVSGSVSGHNLHPDVSIFLEDLHLNTIVPFQNGQIYNFYAEKSTCLFEDRYGYSCTPRFKIHVAPPVACNNSNLQADAGDDKTFCVGETITLGGNPASTGGTGNIQYCWWPPTSDNVPNPVLRLNRSNTYHLMVTDDNGCVSTDVMRAELACPPTVELRKDISKVEAGGLYTLALKHDGTVLSWGDNAYGQLGDGSRTMRLNPVVVLGPDGLAPLNGVIDISAGYHHALALRNDGTVWAWGAGYFGQLATSDKLNRSLPVQVPGLTDVKKIAAGFRFSLALQSDGTLWSWGEGGSGQLGSGLRQTSYVPIQVKGINNSGFLTNVVNMEGGNSHAIALLDDGTVCAWGANNAAQLGTGNFTYYSYPVQVLDPSGAAPLSNIAAVAASAQNSVVVTNSGTVYNWGSNGYGSFGNPGLSLGQHNLPVEVPGLTNIVSVTSSFFVTAALKNNGSVWTWGYNKKGQIGNGTYTNQLTPYDASNGNTFIQISMNGGHLMALKDDATICVLGNNGAGQLGDGTTKTKTIFECADVCLGFQANAGSDVEICLAEETILGSTDFEPGTIFSWSPSLGLSCTDCAAPTASPTNSQLYILDVSNVYGCYSKDSVTVTVHANPYVYAGEDKTVLVNTGNSGPDDPQPCVILDGVVDANGLTYQLSWEPAIYLSDPTILTPDACVEDTVLYTLVATDANNCSSQDEATVIYADIATTEFPIIGNNKNKIQVCHVATCTDLTNVNKNGNCDSPQSLCAHIRHGDYLGPCNCSGKTSEISLNDNSSNEDLNEDQSVKLRAFPNPSSGQITFHIQAQTDEYVTLSITDLYGKNISILNTYIEKGRDNRIEFHGDHLPAGIYYYHLTTSEGIENGKIILIK